MKIVESEIFKNRLKEITNYIKQDKQKAAIAFAKDLKLIIKNLKIFPFKHRASIYFNDKNIRDLIYKGYTIVYEINLEENIITILDIFNKNKPLIS